MIEVNTFQDFMQNIDNGSVDLILTDPPYAISKDTGFKFVKDGEKRFMVSMDFGMWDHEEIDIAYLSQEMFRVLRKGGTAIVWYDVWKNSHLADCMRDAGFNKLRQIIWKKQNPVPLNSKATYLSNAREMAVHGVKGGKATFNSEYNSGEWVGSIPRFSGGRIHPTQKPVELFSHFIAIHTNPGDLVVDPFSGSGTTAVACHFMGRKFKGCEKDPNYARLANERIENECV